MPGYPAKNLVKVFETIKLKYKDIFSMKEFYKALHYWLQEHGWKDVDEGVDHYEILYDETIRKDGDREIRIRWRPYKDAPNAKYLRFHLDIDFQCLYLFKKDYVHEGKKYKADSGEVSMEIKMFIEERYKADFAGNSLLKAFQDIFSKRIYLQTFKEQREELYRETYQMHSYIKQYFKMKRYMPYKDMSSFFGSYSWPSHQKKS